MTPAPKPHRESREKLSGHNALNLATYKAGLRQLLRPRIHDDNGTA